MNINTTTALPSLLPLLLPPLLLLERGATGEFIWRPGWGRVLIRLLPTLTITSTLPSIGGKGWSLAPCLLSVVLPAPRLASIPNPSMEKMDHARVNCNVSVIIIITFTIMVLTL